VGIGETNIKAGLHVSTENTTYGKNAIFGAKGWIDNAAYHYTDSTISLLGRDASDNDKGAGIEFTARTTTNSNWLHGAINFTQAGSFVFINGGAGTTQGQTALTLNSSRNATFTGTITGGAATFKSAAEPQLTLQDSDSSHTGAGAETGIHFKDGAGTLQSAIGHLVSTSNVLTFETAINADMVFKTNSSTRFSIGANGIATTGNSTCTGTVSDSKGDLRKIIFKQESSAYTLVAADAGKAIEIQGNITIPANVFSGGDAVTLMNDGGSDLTISKGTGFTHLFNTADGTNTNRTLAGRGMATIIFVNGTTGYISGAGLS
jgi:hypothetical protein